MTKEKMCELCLINPAAGESDWCESCERLKLINYIEDARDRDRWVRLDLDAPLILAGTTSEARLYRDCRRAAVVARVWRVGTFAATIVLTLAAFYELLK